MLQRQEGAAAGSKEDGGRSRCRAARFVADRPHRFRRAREGKLEQVWVRSICPAASLIPCEPPACFPGHVSSRTPVYIFLQTCCTTALHAVLQLVLQHLRCHSLIQALSPAVCQETRRRGCSLSCHLTHDI